MTQTFLPHPMYRWVTAGCLLVTGLLGWSLIDSVTREEFFFFLLSATISIWFGNVLFSRIQLQDRTITLYTPLRGLQAVDFRQLVSAAETGRMMHSLSLLYRPRQPDGLLDLERIQHLWLPAVVDQEQLLTAIEARIPK